MPSKPKRKISKKVKPPVATQPERLPLHDTNFSWEQFEAFSKDFVSNLPGVKKVHHYGKKGTRQKGIDLYADLENGERWSVQCRQWKKFTATQAEKTIRETQYKANRYYIFVSCEVDEKVRDVSDKHPNWDVWDVRDISQKVHDLPVSIARQLVDRHFGVAWRKEFLGISGATPFVSGEEFFNRLLNVKLLFNHSWTLVGRTRQLAQLHEFVKSKQSRVAIMTGRGAIGKSKILQSFSEEFKKQYRDLDLQFVIEGIPIIPQNVEGISTMEGVIVIDDAHRRDDLPILFSVINQSACPIKIILSLRPQGLDRIFSILTQSGFDTREIIRIDEVKELSRAEVKELAEQVLGPKNKHLVTHLASVTWDCPLVTVIGGRLLVEKAISPKLLERDEDFRLAVLTRFRDYLIGQISEHIPPQICKALLELVAAVQPIYLNSDAFQKVAAEFLKLPQPDLVRHLDVLEKTDVFLRRGNAIRITPDVLSDHILHEACLTSKGEPTGFAQQVFEKFSSICPEQVLFNIAELDWRIYQQIGHETNLLTASWQDVRQKFQSASNLGRIQILDMLKKVAFYQPEKALELVEFAIKNPSPVTEEGNSGLIRFNHPDVLYRLPPILQQISYNQDYLPKCCDLLWELGKDDTRAQNSHTEHALRILKDLIGYDIGKPLLVNQTVLEIVKRWIQDSKEEKYVPILLDILDPLLAKNAYSTSSDGWQIAFRPFMINRENTKSLRDQALQLVFQYARSQNLGISIRGLKSIGDALREPLGYFGQKVSQKSCESWVPDQLELLEEVSKLAQELVHPLSQLKIIDILWWHARYNPFLNVKEKSRTIIQAISDSFQFRLTKCLTRHFDDYIEELEEGGNSPKDYEKQQKKQKEFLQSVVREFIHEYPDPANGLQALNQKLNEIQESQERLAPWYFFQTLSEINPDYALHMADLIVHSPANSLTVYLDQLLYNARISYPDHVIALVQESLESGDIILGRAVPRIYSIGTWLKNYQEQDIEIIKKLIVHPDHEIKSSSIRILRLLYQVQPQQAIDLALSVEISDDPVLADALCDIVDPQLGIPPDKLSEKQWEILLSKLERVLSFDKYEVGEFFSHAVKIVPRTVIQLFLKRIKLTEEISGTDFKPIPFDGFQHRLKSISESQGYEEILREIRNEILRNTWQVKFWLPGLFDDITMGFNSVSLEILNEWINSGEAEKIKGASCLLSHAPASFVFSHLEYVENLLTKAIIISDDCYQKVGGNLMTSATSGLRHGIPGEPMPEDVSLRDKATEITTKYSIGSPVHKFYDSLAQGAKRSIQEQLARDEEMELLN